jgi:sulfate adenylyltransferase
MLISPHGGTLVDKKVPESDLEDVLTYTRKLKKIKLTTLEESDLIMIGIGAYSPLRGFMAERDYLSVVQTMRLADGTVWPMPVTLAATAEEADELDIGSHAGLVSSETGELMGMITIEDIYRPDKSAECQAVFHTEDPHHPGVVKVLSRGEVYIGGPVALFSEGYYPRRFSAYARPEETRKLFDEQGWSSIAAFQTRNPMHRSHEYLAKLALETMDGLLIHPVVGKLKEGDIPAEIRMRCYEVLINNYFPPGRVVCRVYPMEMRYGGPREAVLHAIIRQNFGCSHIIIGRDHAGVGDFYGPFESQNIFDRISEDELAIKPIKVDWTFWCYKCGQMASKKTCPHSDAEHLIISGTKLRGMLSKGEDVPDQFSRPEVIDILKQYYKKEENTDTCRQKTPY